MPKRKPTRKQLFRAALNLAATTAEEWAEERGITKGHLSHVLSGRRESLTLLSQVDEFTRDELRKASALVA